MNAIISAVQNWEMPPVVLSNSEHNVTISWDGTYHVRQFAVRVELNWTEGTDTYVRTVGNNSTEHLINRHEPSQFLRIQFNIYDAEGSVVLSSSQCLLPWFRSHNAPAFHVRNSPSHNALLVEILQPEGASSDCECTVHLNITQLNGWSKIHILSAPGIHLLPYSTSQMPQQLSACFTTSGIDCTSEKSHITRKSDEGE
ncbi:hypothetical protein PHET_09281 [Paragonimus heterotremus]|uniref:Uncharacterized protein n=1 Tax=Paragonimus heterotremus TaxID=100268 RepID=A0A8J4T3D7_9TREM|nr:hypothetical protein PHET_09281 [Paragonimus heterotremus]